jgi:anti-sigma factor RsiW
MPGCHEFSEDLTAWVDQQLPERRHEQVRQHLAGCAHCRAAADDLGAVIAWQRDALHAAATLDGVDTSALWGRLRRDLAAEVDTDKREWSLRLVWASMWGRLALAGAAMSVAAVVLGLAGGPAMVLIPLGLESPPPAVAQRTELFKDYPLIERLDVLEHLDTVESEPLDDESAPQRG